MSDQTPTPPVEDDVEIQSLDSDYDVVKDVETQDEEVKDDSPN